MLYFDKGRSRWLSAAQEGAKFTIFQDFIPGFTQILEWKNSTPRLMSRGLYRQKTVQKIQMIGFYRNSAN